eukprot:CAMPEP_0172894410 /NCGR_PEP_ID=MMETSP1075-20121228/150843_1 /TAXON_ID=2916 /ORGANISM="Ceratium fusus, Strain PA161109" /LENGTH=31 /DNA_ID= /DNA_START= /DNA_END= /DNA_ORIENTATION=
MDSALLKAGKNGHQEKVLQLLACKANVNSKG